MTPLKHGFLLPRFAEKTIGRKDEENRFAPRLFFDSPSAKDEIEFDHDVTEDNFKTMMRSSSFDGENNEADRGICRHEGRSFDTSSVQSIWNVVQDGKHANICCYVLT